jgi:AcrR family transcriptional regulator
MAVEGDQVVRPRRRDAAATRRALLGAARTLMAQRGVEGTSTRDVAAEAGVNQALVYRYFGSKEKLFAEAAEGDPTVADRLIEQTPLDELASALVAHVLDMTVTSGTEAGISALVSAANDEAVRGIIRDRIESSFGVRLAQRLDGPEAALRAELLAALVTGIAFLYRKIGTTAITSADRGVLEAWVRRMAAPLLTASDADAANR